jgi:hypothetical protein
VVDYDPWAVITPVMAVLARNEAGRPLDHELIEVVEVRGRVAIGRVTLAMGEGRLPDRGPG